MIKISVNENKKLKKDTPMQGTCPTCYTDIYCLYEDVEYHKESTFLIQCPVCKKTQFISLHRTDL